MSVYFICASPGSSGNFLGKLMHNLVGSTSDQLIQPTFDQPVPNEITADFWFDNVNIGSGTVIHVPFVPNYTKLRNRFPGCKIIVLTHLINECHSIAANLWNGYYKAAYNFVSEPDFRKVIQNHSNLFSNPNATPYSLTNEEVNTFIKIIAYQKLIAGFHCCNIPNDADVLEIKHKDLYFNRIKVRTDLENFTGNTFQQNAIQLHEDLAKGHIESFFKGVFQ